MGAAILREAGHAGLRCLLLERGDFASGTSSRSSKLIHGGLHYLSRLEVGHARRASQARERLLECGEGLVEPLQFLILTQSDDPVGRWRARLGITAYRMIAGRLPGRIRVRRATVASVVPGITPSVDSGFAYEDGQTDDARLVLRLVREGCDSGGTALNHAAVRSLIRDSGGEVVGVVAEDGVSGCRAHIRARAIVNATGPWCDGLRSDPDRSRRIRCVRGSHLVFPRSAIPIDRALISFHPDSSLPFYLIPWQGVTLVGSTHVEEGGGSSGDPQDYPQRGRLPVPGPRRSLPLRPPSARACAIDVLRIPTDRRQELEKGGMLGVPRPCHLGRERARDRRWGEAHDVPVHCYRGLDANPSPVPRVRRRRVAWTAAGLPDAIHDMWPPFRGRCAGDSGEVRDRSPGGTFRGPT